MDDSELRRQPPAVAGILNETRTLGFNMASELKVGALLAVLAASKPGGRLLELGTGTGHGTAWLLSGMDSGATLDTVDNDPDVVAAAERHLGADSRVTFHVMDGAEFLRQSSTRFDLITRSLAREISPVGRGAVAGASGRHVRHRRSAPAIELARGPRRQSPSVDRRHRATGGVRHRPPRMGIRADARRSPGRLKRDSGCKRREMP